MDPNSEDDEPDPEDAPWRFVTHTLDLPSSTDVAAQPPGDVPTQDVSRRRSSSTVTKMLDLLNRSLEPVAKTEVASLKAQLVAERTSCQAALAAKQSRVQRLKLELGRARSAHKAAISLLERQGEVLQTAIRREDPSAIRVPLALIKLSRKYIQADRYTVPDMMAAWHVTKSARNIVVAKSIILVGICGIVRARICRAFDRWRAATTLERAAAIAIQKSTAIYRLVTAARRMTHASTLFVRRARARRWKHWCCVAAAQRAVEKDCQKGRRVTGENGFRKFLGAITLRRRFAAWRAVAFDNLKREGVLLREEVCMLHGRLSSLEAAMYQVNKSTATNGTSRAVSCGSPRPGWKASSTPARTAPSSPSFPGKCRSFRRERGVNQQNAADQTGYGTRASEQNSCSDSDPESHLLPTTSKNQEADSVPRILSPQKDGPSSSPFFVFSPKQPQNANEICLVPRTISTFVRPRDSPNSKEDIRRPQVLVKLASFHTLSIRSSFDDSPLEIASRGVVPDARTRPAAEISPKAKEMSQPKDEWSSTSAAKTNVSCSVVGAAEFGHVNSRLSLPNSFNNDGASWTQLDESRKGLPKPPVRRGSFKEHVAKLQKAKCCSGQGDVAKHETSAQKNAAKVTRPASASKASESPTAPSRWQLVCKSLDKGAIGHANLAEVVESLGFTFRHQTTQSRPCRPGSAPARRPIRSNSHPAPQRRTSEPTKSPAVALDAQLQKGILAVSSS